jgi:uncharacterized protein (DUF983 family)
MAVKPPIQTDQQLGVSNLAMLWRGLTVRCPVCGSRDTHLSFTTLRPRCETCDLRFERIEGHSIGYIGLNTIVTFATVFLVLITGTFLFAPDLPVTALSIATVGSAIVVPIAFSRPSHTLWTAIDLIMRPLEPGEVDPRFVVVDPVTRQRQRR